MARAATPNGTRWRALGSAQAGRTSATMGLGASPAAPAASLLLAAAPWSSRGGSAASIALGSAVVWRALADFWTICPLEAALPAALSGLRAMHAALGHALCARPLSAVRRAQRAAAGPSQAAVPPRRALRCRRQAAVANSAPPDIPFEEEGVCAHRQAPCSARGGPFAAACFWLATPAGAGPPQGARRGAPGAPGGVSGADTAAGGASGALLASRRPVLSHIKLLARACRLALATRTRPVHRSAPRRGRGCRGRPARRPPPPRLRLRAAHTPRKHLRRLARLAADACPSALTRPCAVPRRADCGGLPRADGQPGAWPLRSARRRYAPRSPAARADCFRALLSARRRSRRRCWTASTTRCT